MSEITRRKLVKFTGLGALSSIALSSCGGPTGGGTGGTGGGGGTGSGGGGTGGGGAGGGGTGGGGGTTPPGVVSGAGRVRADATRMGSTDTRIQAYAEAVRRLRALPTSDPRNWRNLASIHLNSCPHGNWWFLPWHRAYLQSFEDICRGILGDEGFALPYWDWSRNAAIPAAFLDRASPLFNGSRAAGAGSRAAPEMVGGAVIANAILPETNFELFGGGRAAGQRDVGSSGQLEARPHNHVHTFVGGEMATLMSPLDPLFWLHHANVDRIWAVWNGRGNANSGDPNWANFTFNDFFSRSGARISNRVGGLQNVGALGYSYDTLAVASAQTSATTALAFGRSSALMGQRLPARGPAAVYRAVNRSQCNPRSVLSIRVGPQSLVGDSGRLAAARTRPYDALRQTSRAIIKIADIDGPHNENVMVRVFANCANLTPNTPTSDPSYVGSFGFFNTRYVNSFCSTNGMRLGVTMDASRAIRNASMQSGDLVVQLVPVALNGRSLNRASFVPGAVEVAAL